MSVEQPVLMENPHQDNQGNWRYIYPRDLTYSRPFETREAALYDWLRREQYD